MSTPVGDYLNKRYPPNPGATHYLGEGDDPGCCAGPHARCTYEAGGREGLTSLAAELEEAAGARYQAAFALRRAGQQNAAGIEAAVGGTYEGVAKTARRRAESGPAPAIEAAPVSREGREPGGDPDAIQAAGGAGAIAPAVWAAAVILHEAGCSLPGCQHTEHDVGQQDHDLAADMMLAAAPHIAGAERARIITVARAMEATYPVTLEPEPGSEGSTRHAWFPFGDYLEDVPAERQGERADD